MSTQTDTPHLVVASFDRRNNKTYMRARTSDGIDLTFEVGSMALGLLGITIDGVLREERDYLKSQLPGEGPTPPAAPDSPEGLEG